MLERSYASRQNSSGQLISGAKQPRVEVMGRGKFPRRFSPIIEDAGFQRDRYLAPKPLHTFWFVITLMLFFGIAPAIAALESICYEYQPTHLDRVRNLALSLSFLPVVGVALNTHRRFRHLPTTLLLVALFTAFVLGSFGYITPEQLATIFMTFLKKIASFLSG